MDALKVEFLLLLLPAGWMRMDITVKIAHSEILFLIIIFAKQITFSEMSGRNWV